MGEAGRFGRREQVLACGILQEKIVGRRRGWAGEIFALRRCFGDAKVTGNLVTGKLVTGNLITGNLGGKQFLGVDSLRLRQVASEHHTGLERLELTPAVLFAQAASCIPRIGKLSTHAAISMAANPKKQKRGACLWTSENFHLI